MAKRKGYFTTDFYNSSLYRDYTERSSFFKELYTKKLLHIGGVIFILVLIGTISFNQKLEVKTKATINNQIASELPFKDFINEGRIYYEKKYDIVEVDGVKWVAKEMTGDGDKTPERYVFAKGLVTYHFYDRENFSGDIVKRGSETFTYGPFLIDYERGIYSKTMDEGYLHEDFWNHIDASGWKPIPGYER